MDKLGNKDFDGWIKVKKKIHAAGSLRTMREGEIWWCRIGENVGSEICGKGNDFLRPVLVICKLDRRSFIGVPLTSAKHEGSWYVEFEFKGKKEYAVVAQVENISVYRLHHKMGEVPESDLERVTTGLWGLLRKNMSPSRVKQTRTGGYPRKCTLFGTRPSLKVNSILARIWREVKRFFGKSLKKSGKSIVK